MCVPLGVREFPRFGGGFLFLREQVGCWGVFIFSPLVGRHGYVFDLTSGAKSARLAEPAEGRVAEGGRVDDQASERQASRFSSHAH